MRLLFTAIAMLLSTSAFAQQPLKSFSFASAGCTSNPAPLLTFDSAGDWQMDGVHAKPGAGVFPIGNFYIRAVAVTYLGTGQPTDWVLVGHSGPNGDWTTGAVPTGHGNFFSFAEDAAPFFTAGEYLDAHVNACDGGQALISVWYVPSN